MSDRHAACLHLLGSTIRHYRRRQGLTLHDLESMTHLSPSYLAQIERGERNASVLSLIRIADALDLPYTSFLEPLNTLRPSAPPA